MARYRLPSILVALAIAVGGSVATWSQPQESAPVAAKPTTDATASAPASPSDVETPVFDGRPLNEDHEQATKVLNSPIKESGLAFGAAPLSEVIDFIRREYDLEIHLDQSGLDEIGLALDEPITARIRQGTLANALKMILRPLELAFYVEEGYVLITNEYKMMERLSARVYPVGDLLQATTNDPTAKLATIDGIYDVLTSTLIPGHWDDHGDGEASIHVLQPSLLVISQTEQGHAQARDILTAIRRARKHRYAVPYKRVDEGRQVAASGHVLDPHEGSVPPHNLHYKRTPDTTPPYAPWFAAPAETSAEDEIRCVLEAPLKEPGLDFSDIPLSQIVDSLAEEYGIAIQIDSARLEDLGHSKEVTVTLRQARRMSLRSALDLLLSPHDLQAVVEDEHLLITSNEHAATLQTTRVYPIGDIYPPYEENHLTVYRFDPIVHVLTSAVCTDSWSENGGTGELRLMEPGLLVVTQTDTVHREIARFFTALREARQHPYAVPFVVGPPPAGG